MTESANKTFGGIVLSAFIRVHLRFKVQFIKDQELNEVMLHCFSLRAV